LGSEPPCISKSEQYGLHHQPCCQLYEPLFHEGLNHVREAEGRALKEELNSDFLVYKLVVLGAWWILFSQSCGLYVASEFPPASTAIQSMQRITNKPQLVRTSRQSAEGSNYPPTHYKIARTAKHSKPPCHPYPRHRGTLRPASFGTGMHVLITRLLN